MYEHQKIKNYNLLADECGMGKTLTALNSVNQYQDVLIIASKSGTIVWKDYIKKLHKNYTITTYERIKIDDKKYEAVILDEIHRLRNPDTQLFNKISNILAIYKKRNRELKIIGLTGTPIHNSFNDLFTIKSLFHKKSINIAYRTYQDVGLNLPPINFKFVELKLNKTQKYLLKIYSQQYNRKKISLSPYLLDPTYSPLSPKLKYTRYLIDKYLASNKKVIVSSVWKQPLYLLKNEYLKDKQVELMTGETSFKQRAEIVNRINNNESKILLMTLKTGGESINLQSMNAIISLDLWWTWSSFEQLYHRIYRLNQSSPTEVVVLYDETDIPILEAISRKQLISKIVKGALHEN